MRIKHIAIVGVGLIGGSFALAARRAGIAQRITGWDRKEVLGRARARGVIDGIEDAFGSGGVCEADLVYLAAPVGAIVSFLRTRGNSLKTGAIITDAGSTKREICRVAREALPGSSTLMPTCFVARLTHWWSMMPRSNQRRLAGWSRISFAASGRNP
jgi:prephenate dehydrogenase